jgi:hypothetical protein
MNDRPARRWLLRGLVAAGGLLVLAGILFLMTVYHPSWYVPRVVDYAQLPSDRNRLANVADEIGDALNAGESLRLELSEARLQRWLAARTELPDPYQFDTRPVEHPFVELLPTGQVRVAGLVRLGGLEVVGSATLRPVVAGERFGFEVTGAAAGNVPLPRGVVVERLRGLLGAGRDAAPLSWRNDFRWPNGERWFRVAAVTVGDEAVVVELEPHDAGFLDLR